MQRLSVLSKCRTVSWQTNLISITAIKKSAAFSVPNSTMQLVVPNFSQIGQEMRSVRTGVDLHSEVKFDFHCDDFIIQYNFVDICCNRLYPNRKKNVQNADNILRTPGSTARLSRKRFSLTENYSTALRENLLYPIEFYLHRPRNVDK